MTQCVGWLSDVNRICRNEATTKLDNVPYCAIHALDEHTSSLRYRMDLIESDLKGLTRAVIVLAEALERPRMAQALRESRIFDDQ